MSVALCPTMPRCDTKRAIITIDLPIGLEECTPLSLVHHRTPAPGPEQAFADPWGLALEQIRARKSWIIMEKAKLWIKLEQDEDLRQVLVEDLSSHTHVIPRHSGELPF
ncbi:uncharacterized protein [Nicotiana tomentosiformis]|uniref:uncharacterized protein n=1 Tax=Nicotiana tomentosiformis TaxID=4098 RepID=UPI00388C5756